MPARQSKKKDTFQNALEVVEVATGAELKPRKKPTKKKEKAKNPAAVALGLLGASKGGKARAKKLSAKRRKEIAKNAAKTRWEAERQT